MAQAATRNDIEPRTVSLKGTIQTLKAFQPVIEFQGQRSLTIRAQLYDHLLDAIAIHRVAEDP